MDIDQLAKLKDLYDSGGLTDSEFEAAKKQILYPDEHQHQPRKRPALLLLCAAVIAAAAVSAYFLLPSEQDLSTSGKAPSIAAASKNVNADNSLTDAAAKAQSSAIDHYQWAVSAAVIGLNPAFVEKRLGVAKEKMGPYWTFELSGCDISYHVEANAIQSLRAEVSTNCHPIVDGVKITDKTRFAALLDKGYFFADCLQMCGNAADPTIDLISYGARANGNIDVIYGGQYSDTTSTAMEQWVSSLQAAHGLSQDNMFDLPTELVNCVSNAPANVVATMGREHVSTIHLGLDLKSHCAS